MPATDRDSDLAATVVRERYVLVAMALLLVLPQFEPPTDNVCSAWPTPHPKVQSVGATLGRHHVCGSAGNSR
jgi:hypothetical protein